MWRTGGMGDACRALSTPVTGGNVSLYNESPLGAVYPTPVIGMVGLLDDVENAVGSAFEREGDSVILLGDCTDELGGSEYLATIHGVTAGAPPSCDLTREAALVDTLVACASTRILSSAHDCSDGGLLVALAESAIGNSAKPLGASVNLDEWTHLPLRALLFGEAQGRAIVSSSQPEAVLEVAARYGMPAQVIGTVTSAASGIEVRIGDRAVSASTERLSTAFHDAIPQIMARGAAGTS